jgi:P2-related tail formation protein
MKSIFFVLFLFLSSYCYSQIVVTHFNASWNEENKAEWVKDLKDCEITYTKCPKKIKRNKVIVLPTIIIFKDGEEINRWEADLSFKMSATIRELQDYVNELIKDKY